MYYNCNPFNLFLTNYVSIIKEYNSVEVEDSVFKSVI